MYVRKRTYIKSRNTKSVFSFLSRNWLLSIFAFFSLLIGIPALLRYLKRQKARNLNNNLVIEQKTSNTENSSLSPAKLEEKAKKIMLKNPLITKEKQRDLLNGAISISIALGTDATRNRAWFGMSDIFEDRPDVSAFFEDEKSAIKVLKKFPGTFPILAEYYFKVATRSRNLKLDIHQYLSKSEIQELEKHWNKFGKYNWL